MGPIQTGPMANRPLFGCHQPNLYLSREGRVYDCGVGPVSSFVARFDSPDDAAFSRRCCASSGALRQSRRFTRIGWRLCCEDCGYAMGTQSNFAETDLHILTFDILDDALERVADAHPVITIHCTNPLVWGCPFSAVDLDQSASAPQHSSASGENRRVKTE